MEVYRLDFSLMEYALWVMVAFWSITMIDNVYAKAAGGLLLALAVIRAFLEPNRPSARREAGDDEDTRLGSGPEDEGPAGGNAPRRGSRNVF